MLNNLKPVSSSLIFTCDIIFFSFLISISIILFFLSFKLMYSDTRVIIDDWIMNYVKQLLDYIFYTNQKILYERVYKITNTNMDRFLEIFSFVLGFYLSVTAAELLV